MNHEIKSRRTITTIASCVRECIGATVGIGLSVPNIGVTGSSIEGCNRTRYYHKLKREYAITTGIIDDCLSECTACIIRLPVPSIRVARCLVGGRSGRLIDSQYQGGDTIAAECSQIVMCECAASGIGLRIPYIRITGRVARACRGT